ncbi:hypothetical protein KUTeg_018698 [Tegillarca granosa]|uniref:Uncharacterized protein n=1 Tax=Tegillarca granosa TaxID=220873 RepID=A0ABQ9EJS8_TEGGR|nr:hypothetical protein KUTeg_018698 [Tegillarca granosa]
MISYQTRQDIVSLILCFKELCRYKLKSMHAFIIPSRVNSDVIENTFCQQRTLLNGANTYPTYLGYCTSLNAVILGQVSVSRKSNTGCREGAQLFQKQTQSSKILFKIRIDMRIINIKLVYVDEYLEYFVIYIYVDISLQKSASCKNYQLYATSGTETAESAGGEAEV